MTVGEEVIAGTGFSGEPVVRAVVVHEHGAGAVGDAPHEGVEFIAGAFALEVGLAVGNVIAFLYLGELVVVFLICELADYILGCAAVGGAAEDTAAFRQFIFEQFRDARFVFFRARSRLGGGAFRGHDADARNALKVVGIRLERNADLPQIASAADAVCLFAGLVQCGQQKSGQQGDDPDGRQELCQSKKHSSFHRYPPFLVAAHITFPGGFYCF